MHTSQGTHALRHAPDGLCCCESSIWMEVRRVLPTMPLRQRGQVAPRHQLNGLSAKRADGGGGRQRPLRDREGRSARHRSYSNTRMPGPKGWVTAGGSFRVLYTGQAGGEGRGGVVAGAGPRCRSNLSVGRCEDPGN